MTSFGDYTEFGDYGQAGEWGDAGTGEDVQEESGEGNHLPREIDLGGGMKLVVSPEAFRTIMHTPEITAQVQERCEEMAQTANSLAVIDGAEYTYFVSNNPENIRARGRVKPANAAARRDDAENATLLKALASVGSDPLPASYGDWEGSQSVPDTDTDLSQFVGEIGEAE